MALWSCIRMDVAGEARPTKEPNLTEIQESTRIIGFAWLEEAASTRAQQGPNGMETEGIS